jgi:excisionase family DNA binding protein
METRFLEMNEASVFMRISKSTLYKKVMNKEIPFYKVGNKTLFDQVELVAFIKGHLVNNPKEAINEFELLTLPTLN